MKTIDGPHTGSPALRLLRCFFAANDPRYWQKPIKEQGKERKQTNVGTVVARSKELLLELKRALSVRFSCIFSLLLTKSLIFFSNNFFLWLGLDIELEGYGGWYIWYIWLWVISSNWLWLGYWYYIWLAFYFVEDITNDYNHNSMQIIDWSILVQIGPLFQSQHWYISQRPGSCLLPSFLLCWPTPLDVNMAQQKIISFLQLPMSYVWTQIQIFILVNFTPPAYWWTMSFKVSVLYSYFRWELGGISLIQAVGYIWDRANINKLHFRLFW